AGFSRDPPGTRRRGRVPPPRRDPQPRAEGMHRPAPAHRDSRHRCGHRPRCHRVHQPPVRLRVIHLSASRGLTVKMSEQITLHENEHRDHVVCPGCGHYKPGAGVTHGESANAGTGHVTCTECGAQFTWRRNLIVTYTTKTIA